MDFWGPDWLQEARAIAMLQNACLLTNVVMPRAFMSACMGQVMHAVLGPAQLQPTEEAVLQQALAHRILSSASSSLAGSKTPAHAVLARGASRRLLVRPASAAKAPRARMAQGVFCPVYCR